VRRSRVALVAGLIAVLTLATGCGGSGDDTAGTRESNSRSTPATPSATPSLAGQWLELGKTDVALSRGLVRSPEGFAPALTFEVTDGWSSVHRYADSFDVGLPDPDSDGPLVAVTFSVAPEPTGAAALAAIGDRVPTAKATSTSGELGGQQVGRLHLTGGVGTAFTSRDGSVSLDARTASRWTSSQPTSRAEPWWSGS
jgi:hypothetical protein